MTDTETFEESMRRAGREHTHCRYCGRALVDVEEPDTLFDTKTGERGTTIWRQCPRFPRSGLVSLFRGVHECFQRDNPILGREWR